MMSFKVGDKVRALVNWGDIKKGYIYTIPYLDEDGEPWLTSDGNGGWNDYLSFDELELVAPAPAFTLTTGKFYRTASGAVTGRLTKGDAGFEAVVDGKVRIFDAAGGAVHGDDDIIEEWAPRVGERVRFTDECEAYWWFGPTTKYTDGVFEGDGEYEYRWKVKASDGMFAYVNDSHIEPLLVAAQAQPAGLTEVAGFTVGDRVKTNGGYSFDPSFGKIVGIAHDKAVYVEMDGQRDSKWCYLTSQIAPATQLHVEPTAPVSAQVDATAPVSAQVDAIAEEYGPPPANDNAQSAITVSISLDTGNMHEELDELIAKLRKVRKLQRQVGLAA